MIQLGINATLILILLAMLLTLYRGIRGLTLFDRILALNSFGTKAVVLICLHGYYSGRPEFTDIAILYGLINFLGTVTVLKFYEQGTLGAENPEVPRPREFNSQLSHDAPTVVAAEPHKADR